jgi:hypothetical protein
MYICTYVWRLNTCRHQHHYFPPYHQNT